MALEGTVRWDTRIQVPHADAERPACCMRPARYTRVLQHSCISCLGWQAMIAMPKPHPMYADLCSPGERQERVWAAFAVAPLKEYSQALDGPHALTCIGKTIVAYRGAASEKATGSPEHRGGGGWAYIVSLSNDRVAQWCSEEGWGMLRACF